MLTSDAAYDALVARDPRFDGLFFVGVQTTGIYCRPICPARTPRRSRCEFFTTPALAEHAGFRACFRCRPELAPGTAKASAEVDAVDSLVEAAARRITEGALNEASVDDLAGELGVSSRHLRRSVEARLGVSPVELAQTQRLALAKQLLHDSSLPLAAIAFAAGFGSVRRFNALFAARMGRAPSEMRRTLEPVAATEVVTLRLDARAPYDATRLLGFLALRAIPGVEVVQRDTYRRIVHVAGCTGAIAVRALPERASVTLALSPSLLPAVMPLVARVRRLFDLDARPDVIAAALARDPVLARLVHARPGLRVPGALDPFEAAVRALLGQQVSVAAATTLAGRFARKFGVPFEGSPGGLTDGLDTRFPTAAEIAKQPVSVIASIGLPAARAAAVHAFAVAVSARTVDLDAPARDLDRAVAELVALPGVGPWTAHYLAMRALHLPDAFPAGDLVVRKAIAKLDGTADLPTVRATEARAGAWRPFRAYAVLQLWTYFTETP